MIVTDSVILILLSVSALIHEASAALLPPVMLLFFIYAKRVRRVLHFAFVLDLIIVVYAVMMKSFAFSDCSVIAESWSEIYGSPDSFRYNGGLVSVADQAEASKAMTATLNHLKGFDSSLFICLLIGAIMPFIILLLSGAGVFYSSSNSARRMRIILLISASCPIGLCLVGNDFGRWYSMCAINLIAYSLLIAHSAERANRWSSACDFDRNIKQAAVQCVIIATASAFLCFRFDCWWNFVRTEQSVAEYARQTFEGASSLLTDIKPVLSREKVIHP